MHPALGKGPLFTKHPHFPLSYITPPIFHFFYKKHPHFPLFYKKNTPPISFPAYGPGWLTVVVIVGNLKQSEQAVPELFNAVKACSQSHAINWTELNWTVALE